MGKITDNVIEIVRPIVDNEGFEFVDLEFVKEGNNYFLRLFIDNKENDIGLEECEKISNLVSEKLDNINPIEQSFILEVSSPGIERPLKKIEDFDRFEGELATLKTYAPVDGEKEYTGIILKRNEELVRLQIKADGKIIEIPYSSIASARLAVDF